MAKEKSIPEKLLDVWTPPQEAGEPIGFITTTFTFNASFFEEDCLSAFLSIESDPDSESLSYIIEREEKLNKLQCAMVFVDQHHSKTNRNIRWDLISMRSKVGILHAKVSVLFWADCMRIVIASANLTPEGYRENQEVFTFFDSRFEATVPVNVFDETFVFLQKLIKECARGSEEVIGRGLQFISKAQKSIKSWNLRDQNHLNNEVHIYPVFTFSGSVSAISQIKNIWQTYYTFLPDEITIVSPFYDTNQHPKLPVHEINESLLNKNGTIYYCCSGEVDSKNNVEVILNAPEFLNSINIDNSEFHYVPTITPPENNYRPLHAKSIFLEKGNWVLMMMGSGNFTAAGMATGNVCNYEVNLVFITSSSINKQQYDAIYNCIPEIHHVEKENIKWLPIPQEDDDLSSNLKPLPEFILSAEADLIETKVVIKFRFDLKQKLSAFNIKTEDGKIILTSENFNGLNGQDYFEYLWFDQTSSQGTESMALPSGFEIIWSENEFKSWLPLNVKNYNCLTPPAHLKELPLHILLQILTSAKPLHIILKRFFKDLNKPEDDEYEGDQITDPHKRVDTSGFLLQRTSKISYAYNSIKERLSLPTGTINSLHWKLYGPVGLQALVNAIRNDHMSGGMKIPEERLFFLSELLLELSTIEPKRAPNCLRPKEVKDEIKKFIEVISNQIKSDPDLKRSWIKQYVTRAISSAKNNTYMS